MARNLLRIFKNVFFFAVVLTATNFGQHKTSLLLEEFGNDELKSKIETRSSEILTTFNSAFKEGNLPQMDSVYVTAEAKKNINSLWETAPFQCTETEIITRVIKKFDGTYEIRNIPFILKIMKDSTAFEDGVLQFSAEGDFTDLYYGIENHKYRDLLRSGVSLTDFRRRQIILDFVENFRTAYNRKDIELLNNVFSDNALIIVGKVIKIQPEGNDLLQKNFEKEKVELIRYNKKQYITHLIDVFKKNLFIKVGFENIEIVKHRLFPNIYGVTLKQHWQSSTYSDKGYLFLMIDFKDEDRPLIHVRSWQPEEFTTDSTVIGLGDFEIIQ